jgi:hypothetical protein
MNVVEASLIVSPLAGAITAAVSLGPRDAVSVLVGVAGGFAIGVAVSLSTIGVAALMVWLAGIKTEKLNFIQWTASMTAVLAVATTPILSSFVTWFVVRMLV